MNKLSSLLTSILYDESLDSLPCVKYEDYTKVRSLTFKDVRNCVHFLSERLNEHFENRPAVIGLHFDSNENYILIFPAIIAILIQGKSFEVLEEEKVTDDVNAIISIDPNSKQDWPLNLSIKSKECFAIASECEFIYHVKTSGTSAKRKTISVPAESFLPNVQDFLTHFSLNKGIIFNAAPPTFDLFYLDLVFSLLSKSCLLLTSQILKSQAGSKLCNIIARNNVQFCQMTPSLFLSLLQSDIKFPPSFKYLLLGGEPFPSLNQFQIEKLPIQTRIFNVYGLTEMSVWQSLTEIDRFQMTGPVPILSQSQNLLSNVSIDLNEEGEIIIESPTRFCFYEGKNRFQVFTKDLASKDQSGNIFYKCRMDDVFKAHGRRMSIPEIEKKIEDHLGFKVFCALSDKKRILAHFVTPCCDDLIYNKLLQLPSYFIPEKILADQAFPPMNLNGKIDRRSLKENILNKGQKWSISNASLEELWKKFTGVSPTSTSNFIFDGGDSFATLSFAELLESESKPTTIIMEMLFHKTFQDLKSYVDTFEKPISILSMPSSPEENVKAKVARLDKSSYELKLLWKQNLEKCIDASPILAKNDIILIGSHKGLFAAINSSGKVLWSNYLDDRIESTACSDGVNVFVGTYSGSFYRMKVSNGEIIWKNCDANDIIKSQALLHSDAGKVVFGSHDGIVRCISVETGQMIWSVKVQGSVATALVQFDANSFVCATLAGICYKIQMDGKIIWKVALDNPIFGRPICRGNKIFVTSVRGHFYKIDDNGSIQNTFRIGTNKHVFAPLLNFNNTSTIVNTQEGDVFNFDDEGQVLWTQESSNPIISAGCAISRNELLVIDKNSVLSVIHHESGHLMHRQDLGIAETFSTPLCITSGTNNVHCKIVIGSRDNHIYCFQMINTS